ncbi:unnamed protein product [Dovyalis caffra]|uniref:Uncharacterized protein n=1 Tax=Dovyalis caffra TaxID=77055 RepID=A0AAV1RJZ0_9ROSI|nr:unnamed protein product [Dovyalis caffra]
MDLDKHLENVKYFEVDTKKYCYLNLLTDVYKHFSLHSDFINLVAGCGRPITSDKDLISVFKYYDYLELEKNVDGVDVIDDENMNVEGMSMEVFDMNIDTIDGRVREENVGAKTSIENVNIYGVDVRKRMKQVSKVVQGEVKGKTKSEDEDWVINDNGLDKDNSYNESNADIPNDVDVRFSHCGLDNFADNVSSKDEEFGENPFINLLKNRIA